MRGEIHWRDLVFRDKGISDNRAGRCVTKYSVFCVWLIDQTAVLVGLVTYESGSWHDKPGFPVHVVGIQVIRHEYGNNATKAGRQVRSNQGPRR